MKRERHFFVFVLWTALVLILFTGCAGLETLEEVPRDFALLLEMSDISGDEEGSALNEKAEIPASAVGGEAEGSLEDSPENGLAGDPAGDSGESFLMAQAGSFACNSLSEAEKIWYRDMERILGGFGEQEQLSAEGLEAGLNETHIDKIFQCVLIDHPELFFVDGYSYTKFTRGDELISVEFSGTYNVDIETARTRRDEISAAAAEILSGIPPDASDYDKVKYVYDTLIRNTDYEPGAADNQNIYSVFIHHLSVCQGYAKATQYLLNRLGVECALVLGTVETGEGHAWNLVKVDGSYYFVDTTWGDASYRMEDGEGVSPLDMPAINYDYLNVTTAELLRTHTIDSEVPLPECVATEANYYVREGALFTSYDREQMTALFRRAMEAGRCDVTVKCADTECYDSILTALVEEQEIFDYLQGMGSRVACTRNEKQLSLTFWVTNQ